MWLLRMTSRIFEDARGSTVNTFTRDRGWFGFVATVWVGWLFTVVSSAGLLAQEPRPPHGPPSPKKSAVAAPVPVELQVVEAWVRASTRDRRILARLYLLRSPDPSGRATSGSRFAIFEEVLRRSPPRDYRRLNRGPIWERVRRLVEMTDRFARRYPTERILQEIPDALAKMQKSGLATAEEVNRVTSIQDGQERKSAYFALRDLAFLRQMRKDGRIDDRRYESIVSLQDFNQRHREVDKVRRAMFRRINAHLIHFMLTPSEKNVLDKAFGSNGSVFRLRRMERKKRFRFLPVIPSSDPGRLSHLLRLTPEQEARLNRPQLDPGERDALADQVFRLQQKAFGDALVKKVGEPKARSVLEATTPRAFYTHAFRALRDLEEPWEGGPERRDRNVKPPRPRGGERKEPQKRGREDRENWKDM
jgi:hypothetical protein